MNDKRCINTTKTELEENYREKKIDIQYHRMKVE